MESLITVNGSIGPDYIECDTCKTTYLRTNGLLNVSGTLYLFCKKCLRLLVSIESDPEKLEEFQNHLERLIESITRG